jgi:hypothetical protein
MTAEAVGFEFAYSTKPHLPHPTRPSSCRNGAVQRGQCLQASSLPTDRNNRAVHEDPAPTPEEQERAPEELPEHESTSAPGREDDDFPGDEPPADPTHDA